MIQTINPVVTNPRLGISEQVYFKLETERKAFGKTEDESISVFQLSMFTIPDLTEPNIQKEIESIETMYTLTQLNTIIGEIRHKNLFAAYDSILISIIASNSTKFWGLTANDLQVCPNL